MTVEHYYLCVFVATLVNLMRPEDP
ncbi:hypothetical protein COMA2_120083 [Candidatus Nitrospira nitrificans]|uniref:Uncharacterized protein n=1 Tax=Candidatus Nitrospira nitrificans TaxID=1742973 RepID=A0A0S4L6H4_9BACT|nr:hypothetical protein COMA2_120083 [Candidatus Nitrospira nitrificans]